STWTLVPSEFVTVRTVEGLNFIRLAVAGPQLVAARIIGLGDRRGGRGDGDDRGGSGESPEKDSPAEFFFHGRHGDIASQHPTQQSPSLDHLIDQMASYESLRAGVSHHLFASGAVLLPLTSAPPAQNPVRWPLSSPILMQLAVP